ncbi:hypothetical protein HS088_TW21G01759 [Tripterygium wilfordii]|uniref:Uncharacterized protein n=1 Tax=Tripterygium wilfordii TaxID=458696 RepID=A0A7J7C659_TRIWF|nr:hypothetical protein HS088_TW21G01759 [Tripterygium wilfordii]
MEVKEKKKGKNNKKQKYQHPNDQTTKPASDLSFKPTSDVKGLRFGGQFIDKFERKNWRVSCNVLLLPEHLRTHGPLRVAEEFQCHKDVMDEREAFGSSTRKGWCLNFQLFEIKFNGTLF